MPVVLLATDADHLHDEVDAALGDEDTTGPPGPLRPRGHPRREGAGTRPRRSSTCRSGTWAGWPRACRCGPRRGRAACTAGPIMMLLDRSADVFLARRSDADGWLVKPLDAIRIRRAAEALLAGGEYHERLTVATSAELEPMNAGRTRTRPRRRTPPSPSTPRRPGRRADRGSHRGRRHGARPKPSNAEAVGGLTSGRPCPSTATTPTPWSGASPNEARSSATAGDRSPARGATPTATRPPASPWSTSPLAGADRGGRRRRRGPRGTARLAGAWPRTAVPPLLHRLADLLEARPGRRRRADRGRQRHAGLGPRSRPGHRHAGSATTPGGSTSSRAASSPAVGAWTTSCPSPTAWSPPWSPGTAR